MKFSKSVQLVVASLIIGVLLFKVGIYNLIQQFSNISIEALGYLALLAFLLIYVSAIKWKMFLEVLSSKVSVWKLTLYYLIGYFVNLIIPSYVGGDAVRSWYVGKKVGQHQALAATILERYTGVVAMVLMAFTFMWFVEGVTWQIKLIVLALMVGLVIGTLLVLSPAFYAFLGRCRVPMKILEHANKVRDGLDFARGHHMLLLKALLLSFLFHSLAVINTVAAAYAIGWLNPPVCDLFVVLPIILLIGSLPLTPNGLGVQEGAFYYFLHALGATPSQAIAVAVILRAKSYVLAILGGVAWLLVKKSGANKEELPIV